MSWTRRNMLGSSLGVPAALAAAGGVAAVRAAAPGVGGRRPNILLVVLDDVGFADLGCYGSEIRTPAIDALAADGVRFTGFHAAPLCSPTRAALLTGRDPHSVGVGVIADWANGRPGYRGFVDPSVPMLPELLRAQGYGCYAVGKWHLTAIRDQGTTGPFDQWPTRRGFDRWYGFAGANADHWHPELFEGTSAVDPPRRAGYHLSGDLVDRMIGYLGDHVAGAPDRPFFGYLAFGACHWPLHVPPEAVARVRGRYDNGWRQLRQARFERQQAMGLVPPDTVLPPENPDVPPWDRLPAAERRFAARCQELYAAFLEHTDAQIARLTASLERMGVAEDTIVVLLSDNGATAEGSAVGMSDVRGNLYVESETTAARLAAVERLGSEESFPAYPLGWASAGNTPLRWYKSGTHEGGIRTPLIVRDPRANGPRGGMRHQFHHVSDVAPTLFELAGLAPARFGGTSMGYALRDAAVPTRKVVQLFESTGSRAIWQGGWKAVARHVAGDDFARDRWELYHLPSDFAEAQDLAFTEPDRLVSLQRRWSALATAGQILPLDDRRLERYRANVPERSRRCRLVSGGSRVDRLGMPDLQRAHRITASLVLDHGSEGVIVAAGTRLRGVELFLRGGEVRFAYVFRHDVVHEMRAGGLPRGQCRVAVEMGDGRSARVARLLVEGVERARVTIPRSWPAYALGAGLRCGANRGAPVSVGYAGAFPFTGTIDWVEVETA